MGKGARNREERGRHAAPDISDQVWTGPPRTAAEAARARGIGAPANPIAPRPSAAEQVFPNFPYERKFTRAEIADILDRAKAFGDLMRDGVGPNGTNLFIPGDIFELWMIHGVLAGADGGQKFIRPRRLPDENGRLADSVEWVLLKEDTPAAQQADDEREADAILALYQQNLRPGVAEAIRRRLAGTAAKVAAEQEPTHDELMARDGGTTNAEFGAPRLMHFGPDEGNTP